MQRHTPVAAIAILHLLVGLVAGANEAPAIANQAVYNSSQLSGRAGDRPAESLAERLEAFGDRNLIKEIIDRLYALDADIAKLVYNSTSLYAPSDALGYQDGTKEGQQFSEILNDLDSLQDEVSLRTT